MSKAVTPEKTTEPYIGKYSHIIGKKYTDDDITMLADMMYDWMLKDSSNYWIGDFLTKPEIMLNRQRVSGFCKKHEYFNELYQQCKALQERRLSLLACISDKPVGWIFALKNVSGWRDNPEKEMQDDESAGNLSFEGWIEKE